MYSAKTIDLRIRGARLWRARLDARVSQEEAAKVLGLHQTAVSRMEQGGRHVRAPELAVLAKLYGATLDDLVGPFTEQEEDLAAQLRGNINLDHPLLPRRQLWRRM